MDWKAAADQALVWVTLLGMVGLLAYGCWWLCFTPAGKRLQARNDADPMEPW